MCGIAGIVRWDGRPVHEDEIRAMCGVMAHRGPDDEGVYIGDGVAIGMRRLSIIDLDNGYQPISNEDGTVWIVFNGEIYNYQELRRDLEKRGHTLRTASDTETIVHLYEDLGPRCVDRLRGIKRDLYEGGIRVPTLARWPGKIKAGQVSDQVWAFWDFLPTALELAGSNVPWKKARA